MTSANSTSTWNNWGVYAAAVMRLKALAPYALIELILPGGSVMGLLLWLYRRRKSGVGFGCRWENGSQWLPLRVLKRSQGGE
jgi:hypothetical protein